MHTEIKTQSASKKRNTKSAATCTPERRGSNATSLVAPRPRPFAHANVQPATANELRGEKNRFHTDIKTTGSHVSVKECFEEVAGAAHELIEEMRYGIIAISRALASFCRFVVRAATLVLAISCLALAVGIWACTMGKNLCSRMFA
jgi:hypothetical protein